MGRKGDRQENGRERKRREGKWRGGKGGRKRVDRAPWSDINVLEILPLYFVGGYYGW